MKSKTLLMVILVFVGIQSNIFSQTITILDKTTRQNISGVTIFSNKPKATVTTNIKGQVDISAFKGADSIYFRFISYKTEVLSYSQLESLQFKIELSQTNISLNEIIVSANRWEENQIEIPYRVEKIDAKELSFRNTQTSADLLGSSGYAYIQKSQLAGGSPSLRGFATNRVMLVVDGVRMNNAIFRTGNLQNSISIDAASIESTEILFGPGAVMYGSDAIGGVMDFHTLKPKFSGDADKTIFTGNVFGRISSANKEKTGHFDLNIGSKEWAFLTSYTSSNYNDLRAGSDGNSYYLRPTYVETFGKKDFMMDNNDLSLQIGSGYKQNNFIQKISYKSDESWDLDYGFYYSETSNAPRYDRLCLDANNNGVLDYAEWYYGPQKWMMNRVGFTHSKSNKFYDQLHLVAASQNYQESRHDRKFNNKKLRNQKENVDASSLNLDLDKKIGEKSTLFYGAEVVHNLVSSIAYKENIDTEVQEPTTTRYPNGSTWQSYGAYANLKYKFKPKFILNAGLRYSYYIIKADFDTTLFPFPFTHAENKNGALNGSLGLVFSPDKTLQMYANFSTGFRAPNIDDIGKVFESVPGSVVVPNTNLKPEYAYNGEIGMAKTINDFLKIDFAAYYTLLDNALARRNFQYNGKDSINYDGKMSQVQAIQNISQAYVCGVQAGVNINFGKGIGLKSTICYQYGKEESIDSAKYYPTSHVPPMFGITHLTYERKKLKFDFYVVYNSKMDYEDLALSERQDDAPYAKDANGLPFVPAWSTLNFKAAFYINKNIALNAGVENITDKLYRPFESGISAPGRNFIVALKGSF
ncbi:MAG: TonB-dependent receptor [Bacteroidetes bacterium]|nr:TonB-dependent receptor [Bacteroidota bacterium]